MCARLRESSKAGRGKESQIRDEFTDRRWIDLSLSRSDWEAEVVDLVTVWVGCRDRPVLVERMCQVFCRNDVNRVKGYSMGRKQGERETGDGRVGSESWQASPDWTRKWAAKRDGVVHDAAQLRGRVVLTSGSCL